MTLATHKAYRAGVADYYAVTAKGGEAINRFAASSDESNAWASGHEFAYFQQARFYLAANPETIYNFFGITPQ